EMLKLDKKEFWFVVGSQHLYGKETLDEVEKQSKEIINNLSENGDLPYSICFKQLVTTEKEITSVMKEANYREMWQVLLLGCILSRLQKCGYLVPSYYKNHFYI